MTTQKTISQLTELTAAGTTDELAVVDNSGQSGVTKRITVDNAFKSVPAGQASAPGLAFAADVDTGIARIGADQLALCTGGQARLTVGSTGDITIGSNLIVDGTTTSISSETLVVEDRNIELGTVASPSDTTANGGGITLKGATDKTIQWVQSTGAWTFNQPTNFNDHVLIDGSGNVGVGTSSPAGALHVDAASGVDGPIFDSGGTANSNHALLVRDSANNQLLRVNNDGKVGIGTTSPSRQLTVNGDINLGSNNKIESSSSGGSLQVQGGSTFPGGNILLGGGSGTNDIRFRTSGASTVSTERMRIDSDGNVKFEYTDSSTSTATQTPPGLRIYNKDNTLGRLAGIHFSHGGAGTANAGIFHVTTNTATGSTTCLGDLAFYMKASGSSTMVERMRIDSDGRLLIGGTSTADDNHANINTNGVLTIRRAAASNDCIVIKEGSTESLLIEAAGNVYNYNVGSFAFTSWDNEFGTSGPYASLGSFGGEARISAGSTASDDVPLVFRTASGGTLGERLRIGSNGYVYYGDQTGVNPAAAGTTGLTIRPDPLFSIAANGNSCMNVGRNSNDGALVNFYQAAVAEGSISVSGTTVSYNGAHLARWSQLASGAERTEILRGSVLSNIDEMCEWGEEENEQLNRMQVSNVEGDRNVSGVFQAWDDDDDTYINDFYCAMTGDFVIRIAQGTTVARGDLLMSAGDGTAKPQDDDIIRSKTIAKVTSTHVSETYADGSYCVPCVLMAC